MQATSPDQSSGILPSTISSRTVSRIAGASYLGIIVCGIFAEFVVRTSLIVPGDALATAANIAGSEQLFRFGIAADLLMLVFDAVLAIALYVLLCSVNKPIAQLAMAFRLVHAAVVGAVLFNLFTALDIAKGAVSANELGMNLAQQHLLPVLNAHGNGYVLGLVFFAVHCGLLAYLLLKSHHVPKILVILIIAAALGYLIDGFALVLLTDYSSYAETFSAIVIAPAVIGELSFALWLLLKGFPAKQ